MARRVRGSFLWSLIVFLCASPAMGDEPEPVTVRVARSGEVHVRNKPVKLKSLPGVVAKEARSRP